MDKEKLIEIVREYRCIYDTNDKFYGDVDKKELAWREIGNELQQPPDACKLAWNYIRDAFRRILKKKKRAGGVGKKWKYEDELFFLLPFLKDKDRNSSSLLNENTNSVTVFEDTWNASTIQGEDNAFDNADSDEHDMLPESYGKPNSSFLRRPVKRRDHQIKSSLLLNHILNEKRFKSDAMDDIDLFFASIAKTVKQFSPINRAVSKQKVFGLVSEIEMQELRKKNEFSP